MKAESKKHLDFVSVIGTTVSDFFLAKFVGRKATESVPQGGSVWLKLCINSFKFEKYCWPHGATRYRAVALTLLSPRSDCYDH